MRTVSLPLVVVALLLTAMVPGRADEFKPGYLQLTQLDRETYDVLWKVPAIDEVTTLKAKPQFPDGTEALTRGAQHLLARCDGAALAHPCAGRARREGHSLLAAVGNPDRRARAARAPGRHRAARAHPAGEPKLRRQAKPRLSWKWSGHIPFSGSNTSCPGSITCCSCSLWCSSSVAGADGRHDHGVYRGAQSDACRRQRSAGCTCPRPPVEASIALSIVFVASEIVQTRRPLSVTRTSRGSWLSPSACCTDSALPARWRRSACRSRPFRSPCCSSMSAWRLAVAVRRSRVGSHRSWLARGTTASIVANRLALAHRAVCHRRARELLAGRTSRRVLTTGAHVAFRSGNSAH